MRKVLLILSIVSLIISCKKDPKDPGKAELVFPAKDEACTQGKIVSATESSVVFTWTSSNDTDEYELRLKNLLSGVSTSHTATKAELEITLSRNTPYSWSVVSKSASTSTTAESDVWKFYNSGPGTTSYAPFPAEIVSPVMGQIINSTTGTITLHWKGSDVDNDIVGFDVYFGTTASPGLLQSNVTAIPLNASVALNTLYYWKIITKDAKGNTSDSGVYQVKVN